MDRNHTTTHTSPVKPKPGFRGSYAVILVVLLVLAACAVAAVVYIRRRSRSVRLRHRLVPVYRYDPTEEPEEPEDWEEEEDVARLLHKDGTLCLLSDYGT